MLKFKRKIHNSGKNPILGGWLIRIRRAVKVAPFWLQVAGTCFAAGVTIPAGSKIDVNTGTLNVSGDITIAGDLETSTGKVGLTGSWTNASGTYTAGTGTVDFTSTTLSQIIISGGIGDDNDFYDLTHSGTETLTVSTDDLDIDGSFTNSFGTFATAGYTMTVAGTWTVSSGATFNHGNSTVVFDGTDQSVFGETSFYNWTKVAGGGSTITFQEATTQTVNGTLTFRGDANLDGQRLGLQSTDNDASPTQFNINLISGAQQDLQFLNVNNSDATGIDLLARNSVGESQGNDDLDASPHWVFGSATLTWNGSVSDNWDTAGNWDLGIVPLGGDTAVVPDVTGGGQPQPVLQTDVSIGNLTISSSTSTMSLAGNNLTLSSTLSNDGTIQFYGSESISIVIGDTDSGTFEIVGDNDAIAETPSIANITYYNLKINDVPADDTYRTNADTTILGDLTVTASTFDPSTNGDTLAVIGTMFVNGGTFTATNATVDLNNLDISGGTFTSSDSGSTFTISGDFTDSTNGSFVSSSGTVVFDGTAQTVSLNGTAFGGFDKSVTVADTFTFVTGLANAPTIAGLLTLKGVSGNILTINSDVATTQAAITLNAGGTQDLDYLSVRDSDASGGVTLVARNSSELVANSTDNWIFGGTTFTWQGDVDTNWEVAGNWDIGLVPGEADTALIPSVVTDPTLTLTARVETLTVNFGATLSTDGYDLTVDGEIFNEGSFAVDCAETIAAMTVDLDSGTFTYIGDANAVSGVCTIVDFGSGIDYYNLEINDTSDPDIFRTVANTDLNIGGTLNVTASTMDISSNPTNLTVASTLTINGATAVLTAANGTIDLNSDLDLTLGTFTAPDAGGSIALAGDWNNGGGTFTHSSGEVILDTTTSVLFTGDTIFYDLTSITAGKTIAFTAASTQTIENILNFQGTSSSEIILQSSVAATQWNFDVTSGVQAVSELSVSDANVMTNDIACVNCTNGGGNDDGDASPTDQWIFTNLTISVPQKSKITDTTPTIIGVGDSGVSIDLRIGGCTSGDTLLGSTTIDSGGMFRFEPTAANAISPSTVTLFPCAGTTPGGSTIITTLASPSTDQQPVILSHIDGDRIRGATPTFAGKGLSGENFNFLINSTSSSLATSVVSGTIDGSGNFSQVTDTFTKGLHDVSITIDGVATDIISVSLTDPFGDVFETVDNLNIQDAEVTIYRSDTGLLAVPGVDLDAGDVNPVVTGSDGFYSFLAADGTYFIGVNVAGYDHPSTASSFPSGRVVITGSKGEEFTVASVIIEMDHPVDPNGLLLRIEKDANKKEATVGAIVTYTIDIENLTNNMVNNVYINDKIPPGFKYVNDRVILDGVPITNPTGNRPLLFNVGDFAGKQKKKLKYQLVVGSGVTVGDYQNSAIAQFESGQFVSNRATEKVQIVLDPLFDLGTIIGKVFMDKNENGIQDKPEYIALARETIREESIPYVQIAMEDGTVITTDRQGRFSIPSLTPGRHLFRLDERTLPKDSYLTTEKVVIIDVTPGSTYKVNFGVNRIGEGTLTKDERFFAQKVRLDVNKGKSIPRLNVNIFGSNRAATALPLVEEVAVYRDVFVDPVEFRIATNYAPYIHFWKLEILDPFTRKLVKMFAGNQESLYDPIYWNGKDNQGKHIKLDRHYIYVLTVEDKKGDQDKTREQSIKYFVIQNDQELAKYKKEKEGQKKMYEQWIMRTEVVNALEQQNILIDGEMIVLEQLQANVQSVQVMKNGKLIMNVPLVKASSISARELLEGRIKEDKRQPVQIILPRGEYEILVREAKQDDSTSIPKIVPFDGDLVLRAGNVSDDAVYVPATTYKKSVKIGDDYMFFVGLGDTKLGYNFNSKNIEAVSTNDKFRDGFWKEGKAAYYLKGKVKGKYLITSSFDTNRKQKELFKKIEKDKYYPIYGDQSKIDYKATNTQGNLYFLMEWDKSSVTWGNYSVGFKDTEFAKFQRTLYGGKVDFQTLGTTKYGEARTKIVAFRAVAKQRGAHNEFLATGGSLYFFKHKDIIQGSDKVKIEIRDSVTGLVISEKDMVEGADYELDYVDGRMIFWRPVPILVDTYSIISNELLAGNLVYVVADYEYEVKDKVYEANVGARVRQALGDSVLIGGTYVKENLEKSDYQLRGTDIKVQLGKNAKVIAEYAESQSEATGTFVSTDGGLTFNELATNEDARGRAYGIKGDARLFNRLAVQGSYKWVENDFSTTSTSAQQGKEITDLQAVYDYSKNTKITARHNIQALIEGGNLQTQLQVGAIKTSTTMLQFVHQARKLRLTGEYQRKEVTSRDERFVTQTNVEGQAAAFRADYKLTDKIDVSLAQQSTLRGKKTSKTTLGVTVRPTEKLTVRARKTLGEKGFATGIDAKLDLTGKLALVGDYSLKRARDGTITNTSKTNATTKADKVLSDSLRLSSVVSGGATGQKIDTGSASVGVIAKVTDDIEVRTSVGMRDIFNEVKTTTMSVGGTYKVNENSRIGSSIDLARSSANQSAKITLGGKSKIDDQLEVESAVELAGSGTNRAAKVMLGGKSKLSKDTEVSSRVELSRLNAKQSTKLKLGGTSKIDDKTSVRSNIELENIANNQLAKVSIGGSKKVDDKTSADTSIALTETSEGGQSTSYTFGTKKKLNEEFELASTKTFGSSVKNKTQKSGYTLRRVKDGRTLQGSLSRKYKDNTKDISQSNIFGLQGDINDRWAVSGSYERGDVQNYDGSETNRNALSFGLGYVNKDPETGDTLKSSTKAELRMDSGDADKRQYLFYNATEGKVTSELSVFTKVEFSKTQNLDTGSVDAQHTEIILGGAYRPIMYDRLNALTRYTYQENVAPVSQKDIADVEQERMHVVAADIIYDITEKWQIADKFAYRIRDEKVTGFDFTKTHTWLLIQRFNYNIDENWLIGGEFRILTQREAKDTKRGFLVEAARRVGEFAQIGVGYNFTDFDDDLTRLNYSVGGPFVRLTGKLYDRTPQERERARLRWLAQKVDRWAWKIVNYELNKTDSPVLKELNDHFALAQKALDKEDSSTARQIYRNIITAGRMMHEEAVQHIYGRIDQEENLKEMSLRADEFIKNHEFEKARKILEKILEELNGGAKIK